MTSLPTLVTRIIVVVALLPVATPLSASSTDVPAGSDVVQVSEAARDGMEKEVLGPLRVWHIVFLVSILVVIAVTVVCCCVDWRIPRTRQEIEETYRQRQMNQKYLRQLERAPDTVLKPSNNINDSNPATVPQEKKKDSQQQQQRRDIDPAHRHQQQQQQQQAHHLPPSAAMPAGRQHGASSAVGVAVTDTSARMARLAKSQMRGVQTPFNLGAITALKSQRPTPRLDSGQRT